MSSPPAQHENVFDRLSPMGQTFAGIVLALANFTVFLDLTIANVSVPHIAGNLGITPSQGTWVISSYAVAEAICVPLTGWLTTWASTLALSPNTGRNLVPWPPARTKAFRFAISIFFSMVSSVT